MMLSRSQLRVKKIGTALRHPVRMWPESREFIRGLLTNRIRRMSYADPEGTAALPALIYYFINSECNLKCKMCDIGLFEDTFFTQNTIRNRKDYLTLEEFRKFTASLHWHPSICINGSEPLLHPQVIDFVRAISESGCRAEMITNGMLLERKAEALIDAGIHQVSVSLDGIEEIHDEIRGVKGSFAKAVRGIQAITEIRRKRGLWHPLVTLNCVVTPLNQDRLVEIADGLTKLDASALFFTQFNFTTGDTAEHHNRLFPQLPTTVTRVSHMDPAQMDIPMIQRQIREIIAKYPDHNLYFRPYLSDAELQEFYHDPKRIMGRFGTCRQPWLFGQMLPNGDCNVNSECFAKPFGNIRETPFEDIWNNEGYRSFRRLLKENDGALPGCSRCHALFCADDKKINFTSLVTLERQG